MRSVEFRTVLLIEDEAHKREELSGYLQEYEIQEKFITVVDSVRQAIRTVEKADHDLIILDMALPTFTIQDDVVDGGLDQALGGMEVLRSLQLFGKVAKIIIVTQHPEVSIGGKRMKLKAAQVVLRKKYQQDIKGAVLYRYKSLSNRQKLRRILDTVW